MNILVFSYWSINEGIAQATLFPLLASMERNEAIEKTCLCTVEPKLGGVLPNSLPETVFAPIQLNLATTANKTWALVKLPLLIQGIIKKNNIHLLWCKGAPAGGVGALIHILFGTPFVVDSFEPHSRYMLDSGTWSKLGLKYFLQRQLEKLTSRTALALLPVSHQYAQFLSVRGVEAQRLFVLPCVVNLDQFSFDTEKRRAIRKKLSVPDDWVVGIYVGKYGGLYYDDESFGLYENLFAFFGRKFYLILITEADNDRIRDKIAQHGLPLAKVYITRRAHSEIPAFLSASDFAISTIKSVEVMRFCSPIKHGEYWASGLPIVTTLAVGDDAEIMAKEQGGIIVEVNDPKMDQRLQELKLAAIAENRTLHWKLANRYRNPVLIAQAIEFVLKRLVTIKAPAD